MTIELLSPPTLGPVLFPYSQGAAANGMIFTAGQVALDHENKVVAPGDAYGQTIYALSRVSAVLAERRTHLCDIVSATAYLTSLDHLGDFNTAWTEMFGTHRPARATIIAGLLIDELVVEITAVAICPTSAGQP